MARKTRGPQQPPPADDDTEAMIQAAGLLPDKQIAEVLRFIRTDLNSEPGMAWLPPENATRPPMLWSGFLKGLPRRPCASPSGRLKVQWLAVREPRPLSRAILQRLQQDLRDGINKVLGLGAVPMAFRGIWNLDMIPYGRLSMTAEPGGGGFVWQYFHVVDVGAQDAPVPGIVLAVAQLVAEHADRIRVCQLHSCNVIFLANRHQEFCTTTHGQLARDQTKKKKGK